MTSNEPTSERDGLLREGARLLYTVAAGQFFQLDDVNAWFERYNRTDIEPDDYGAIAQRQSESDPLVDQATSALADLRDRAAAWCDQYRDAVAAAQQGGGS